MADYTEVFKILKNCNANEEDVKAVLGEPPAPQEKNKKEYSMSELGEFAKELKAKTAKLDLYFEKRSQDVDLLEKKNGRIGVTSETIYKELTRLAKNRGFMGYIDREALFKKLNSRAFAPLRIETDFFYPSIMSLCAQLLKGVK